MKNSQYSTTIYVSYNMPFFMLDYSFLRTHFSMKLASSSSINIGLLCKTFWYLPISFPWMKMLKFKTHLYCAWPRSLSSELTRPTWRPSASCRRWPRSDEESDRRVESNNLWVRNGLFVCVRLTHVSNSIVSSQCYGFVLVWGMAQGVEQ